MERTCRNCKFFFITPIGGDGLWDFTKEACDIKKLDYHLYKKTTCDSYSPKEIKKENKMERNCYKCVHYNQNSLYCNKKGKSTWSDNYCIQFATKEESPMEETGNIFYVHNPWTGYTKHEHTFRGSAEDEAKRLAKENPGTLFQVLRRESTFISKPIEIRRYPDNEDDIEIPF